MNQRNLFYVSSGDYDMQKEAFWGFLLLSLRIQWSFLGGKAMKDVIMAHGIVISSMAVGDYDKRVVLLTKELGKIAAFARGARRSNSSLLASTRPFTLGIFTLYPGKDAYIVQSAEVNEYFEGLSNDMEAVTYGYYFLEIANYYTREGIDESPMINLLYVTIKALLNPNLNNQLVKLIFELRAIVIGGSYPELFHCVNCGQEIQEGIFSIQDHGTYCPECKKIPKNGIPLDAATTYALQYMIAAPINKLYTFTLSEKTMQTAAKVIEQCKKQYQDKTFHSLEILEQMVGVSANKTKS